MTQHTLLMETSVLISTNDISRHVNDIAETIQTSSWLNIRKVTAQRAENHQKNYKKDNFYIISIEIVFIYLSWTFLSQPLSYSMLSQ
ncbi:hypothetical protein RJB83_03665 [Staphylococcus epidermidis]|nr:hypothetical protein [Staphylococcus epidermidis]